LSTHDTGLPHHHLLLLRELGPSPGELLLEYDLDLSERRFALGNRELYRLLLEELVLSDR
jgi:hypothetical protein